MLIDKTKFLLFFKGYHPSEVGFPHFLFKFVSMFDTGARRIAPFWGKKIVFNNSKVYVHMYSVIQGGGGREGGRGSECGSAFYKLSTY